MITIFYLFILSFLSLLLPAGDENPGSSNTRPNVLFIAVDDLRPELGCYGKSYISSPNIDRLATEGCLFTNHFVQVPTCLAVQHAYRHVAPGAGAVEQ